MVGFYMSVMFALSHPTGMYEFKFNKIPFIDLGPLSIARDPEK